MGTCKQTAPTTVILYFSLVEVRVLTLVDFIFIVYSIALQSTNIEYNCKYNTLNALKLYIQLQYWIPDWNGIVLFSTLLNTQ